MKRISGHNIDEAHLKALKSHPFRIHFYVDGIGAMLNAAKLYDLGDKALAQHLREFSSRENADFAKLYDNYYAPPAAPIHAEILSYCLAFTEIAVISQVEARAAAAGKAFFPNALLVNRSRPMETDLGANSGNILEALYPLSEIEFNADQYLDVSSEGIVYSAKKIDRAIEKSEIMREISRNSGGDPVYLQWLHKNFESLDGGIIYQRNQDSTVGKPINFCFSEQFFDELSDRIQFYSRLGEYKVHWRVGLRDFGEKGVDCDLIMQVMDDLHKGHVDAFVFMTNDMDFFPLMERVRREGKYVFLCGCKGKVSQKLRA